MSREDSRTRMVTVFAPGSVPDAYQHALACCEGGLLREYVTSLYYKPEAFPYSLMRYLPRKLASKIERQIRRRYIWGLDEDLVTTYPTWELLFLAARSIDKDWAYKIMRRRDDDLGKKVGKLLDPRQTDVVLASDTPSTFCFERAKAKGIKCVLGHRFGHFRAYEKIFEEEVELNPEFAFTWDKYSIGEKEALERQLELADKIIVGSKFAQGTFVGAGVSPSKLVVIPYGVDTDKFIPATDRSDDTFRIVFVGQVGQRKGVKYLLEAFKQLALPKSELLIIGNIVGEKSSLAPYEGYFRHVAHVPHSELVKYYASSDVFVFPSLFEGFALVILEAMASGLPVIVTPNTGGDVVRDGTDGFVVPIRNVEALKEKIALLYENRGLARQMGLNARSQAEKCTWRGYRQRIRECLVSAA